MALLTQFLERLGVAEERRDVDQQVLQQLADLMRVLRKQAAVLGHVRDAVQSHPAFDAPEDGALLVAAKIAARLGQHEGQDVLDASRLSFGLKDGRRLSAPDIGMPEVFQQRLGHPIRRKDVIDQSRGNRAARHRVELGRAGVLRDGQPAAAPDRPHAQRPVRAGPGKEDADRPLLPIFGQRAEEEVDGHPNAVLLDRLGQIEDSIADAQVLIGRNDVNAVRFDGHGILCLHDLHARVLGHEFRQQTRVGGRQVLDDNESRSAVGGHGREEILEGPQRTGRPAQPDHRDARRTASRFSRLLIGPTQLTRFAPAAVVECSCIFCGALWGGWRVTIVRMRSLCHGPRTPPTLSWQKAIILASVENVNE